MDYPAELTAQQRAALITVRLVRGERLSNAQVALLCGYGSLSAAYRLMMHLAAMHDCLPLCYVCGEWYLTVD